MTDDRFFVLEHPSQDVVLVGFGVVITDEEDRTVGEGTAHQSDGDVLVVGVEGGLGGVVLRDEGVRRHRIHVLCNQAGDNAQGGECQTQLEVQRVVDGVVQTLVTTAQITRGVAGGVVGVEDLANGVTNTEVGPVHVTGDHKDATDGQVVMGNVGEPQGFALGVETSEEGEDRRARAVCTTESLAKAVGVLGINAPVTSEEGSQTCRVGQGRQEVVPADVLATCLRNGDVNKVTGPSNGAETEQHSQVVVQARLSVFEPGQGGAELGLQVQPASEQSPSRQDHHEDGALVQLGVGAHADRVPPVVQT